MKGMFHYTTVQEVCYEIPKYLAKQNPGLLCKNESREEPVAHHCQGGSFGFHYFWPVCHAYLICYQSNLT